MSYFSRLTDIVTCNLTKLLEEADDPHAALEQIIQEMEEGVGGARRSMRTAESNEQRLRGELDEHSQQVAYWADKARNEVKAGKEDQARLALVRKREAENLIAGLGQQLDAAISTRDHLATTFRALEARLAEAVRRRATHSSSNATAADVATVSPEAESMASEIENELAALKRELGGA